MFPGVSKVLTRTVRIKTIWLDNCNAATNERLEKTGGQKLRRTSDGEKFRFWVTIVSVRATGEPKEGLEGFGLFPNH